MPRHNYLVIDQFKDKWFPNRDGPVYHDFYLTKYLEPVKIKLKPEHRLKVDGIRTNYFSMDTHAELGCNLYLPYRFKKRYKVVIEPWKRK